MMPGPARIAIPNPRRPLIRRANEADAPRIVDFNARLALETEGRALDGARLASGVRAALRDPTRARYFVAEVDEQPVGQAMVTYEWSDWRDGAFWWLQSVYVEPAWRRQGVFRALFEAIRAEAESRDGVCGLRLYVEHENREAMGTYRTLGMKPAGYELYELDWSDRSTAE